MSKYGTVRFYKLGSRSPFKCSRCGNRAGFVKEIQNGSFHLEPVCHKHRTYYLSILRDIEKEIGERKIAV
jgi:hypothetical protein